ncbi:MFS amino acid permease [Rhodotorula diobovata]|uniref:MFS amino acid permease n=1 Tax=Rhodotorula diobovata TaxID=5288 RepID=A0A5C5G489_9BASI|nr:MFS amino acid permease [Rhodotorula diobovata]
MALERTPSTQAVLLPDAALAPLPRSTNEAVDIELAAEHAVVDELGQPVDPVDSRKADSVETVVGADGAISGAAKPVDEHSASGTASRGGRSHARLTSGDRVAVIPKNNLPLVMFSLALTTFLAALDSTAVATSLSTIQRELDGTAASLSLVTGAYLLCITALAPCYGKLSDYYGRKWVLYVSIVIFMIGSALCGAAQNIVWLCVCRGVQGVGGGGILQLVNIVVGDITSLEERGRWSGAIGSCWGIAAVLGPLVGGACAQYWTWRGVFYINLPAGGVALALLFFYLKLNPHTPPKAAELLSSFDFLGLALLVAGLALLVTGFTFGEQDWSQARAIACLVVGAATLGAAIVVELRTKRSPIIPPRLFRLRTAAGLLVGVFVQSFAFNGLAYYAPLYFQVLGASPLMAGVLLIPFSVGTALFGVISGFMAARWKRTKELIIGSYFFSTLGFALLASLDSTSNRAKQMLYLLIAALGIGPLFQLPLLHLQAAMPVRDLATSTATLALLRSVGGTVGIAVAGAVYASKLRTGLEGIEGWDAYAQANGRSASSAAGAVEGLTDIEPPELRRQVLHVYARALNFPWIVAAPLLAVGFVASLFVKHYSMQRATVRAPKEDKKKTKGEKALEVTESAEPRKEDEESA